MLNTDTDAILNHNKFDGSVSMRSSGTFTIGQLKESKVISNYKNSKILSREEEKALSIDQDTKNKDIKNEKDNNYEINQFTKNDEDLNSNNLKSKLNDLNNTANKDDAEIN